ncbi:DNA cytosine methyltransferase [Massilia timonae]|uniref:DNA cytosine methyltransferase n=1 Tax=Massilia timonae TaxID=47229 RepID=UPI0028A0EE23|nr:DNA cytosine methyltransferase [Massilia timonae]
MRYIELFAGCGGLSLGLRAAGGRMLLANELSPMAAETFAYNLLGEDLKALAKPGSPPHGRLATQWLSSEFGTGDLARRLRENPHDYPELGTRYCDLSEDGTGLEGALVVGNVRQLNAWLNQHRNQRALERLRDGFGHGNVDLVSGGPPCQSFSMAGMREYTNSRNDLPMEFAKFVRLARPKFALLENVTGILRPFKVDGSEVFAWVEVAKAFARIGVEDGNDAGEACDGYVPLCLHVNAKFAGVAQNRTRFIMLAFRRDVFDILVGKMPVPDCKLLLSSVDFFEKAREGKPVGRNDLPLYDAAKQRECFDGTFLARLSTPASPPTAKDAIDDLLRQGIGQSGYVLGINQLLGPHVRHHGAAAAATGGPENHSLRNHGFQVKARFRVYQVLSGFGKKSPITAAVLRLLRGDDDELDEKAWEQMRGNHYYTEYGFHQFESKQCFQSYLEGLQTRKSSQQALVSGDPAPAALSIPDDVCHYNESSDGLRTLTVREMARIQSFPDNFVFRSKETTGGEKRKYEVPQYTQVGNAVPPLLGHVLGQIIQGLLEQYREGIEGTRDRGFLDAA